MQATDLCLRNHWSGWTVGRTSRPRDKPLASLHGVFLRHCVTVGVCSPNSCAVRLCGEYCVCSAGVHASQDAGRQEGTIIPPAYSSDGRWRYISGQWVCLKNYSSLSFRRLWIRLLTAQPSQAPVMPPTQSYMHVLVNTYLVFSCILTAVCKYQRFI